MDTEHVSADMPEYRSGHREVATNGGIGKSDRQVLIEVLKALEGSKKKIQEMLNR